MNSLDTARRYQQAGLCVLPAVAAEKRVVLAGWKQYRQRLPTDEELRAWFARDAPICIVAGQASANLEMLDFDCAGEKFAWWKQLVDLRRPNLVNKLVIERSPSGGYHVVYRCALTPNGNMKLAERAVPVPSDQDVTLYGKRYKPRKVGERYEVWLTLIETRGEGGIFLCDPTPGYQLVQGRFEDVPTLTDDERETLLEVAWSLNERPVEPEPEPKPAPSDAVGRPGDDYNERGDLRELLQKHGWTLVKPGDNEYWRRPGKSAGWSATLKDCVFYVHSSNAAPFEADTAYSPFRVYALLEHGGDFSEAASALRAQGYGGANDAEIVPVDQEEDDEPEPDDDDESADPGEFPVACLRPPGLIEEIVDYNLTTSIYPELILALAGAIALVGTITGRKIRDRRDCRTNVFQIVLAPSGVGKDKAREVNKDLLVAANCVEMIGPDRLTSHVGIMSELHAGPVKLFQPDEFHATVQSAVSGRHSPHLKHIPEVLKEAYSSASSLWKPTCYGDRKQNLMIDQPHAVLHATVVPGAFWEAVSTELVLSGFIGRIVLYEVPKRYPPPTDFKKTSPPNRLVERIGWWRDLKPSGNLNSVHPAPIVIDETPEAHDRLFAHMQDIRRRQTDEDEVRSALWGRSAQKTSQLALIFAASRRTGRDSIRVELRDIELAITLNNWSTRKLVHHALTSVADGTYQRCVQKLLNLVPRRWTRKKELTRKTFRVADRLLRERVLDDLIESGKVEVRTLPGKTKPVTEYRRKCP